MTQANIATDLTIPPRATRAGACAVPLEVSASGVRQAARGLRLNGVSGRRCVSRPPTQEAGRQEQDGVQKREHSAERHPNKAERQGEQPEDWPQYQGQHGQRPAQNKQKAPGNYRNQRFHKATPLAGGRYRKHRSCMATRRLACDERVKAPDKTPNMATNSPSGPRPESSRSARRVRLQWSGSIHPEPWRDIDVRLRALTIRAAIDLQARKMLVQRPNDQARLLNVACTTHLSALVASNAYLLSAVVTLRGRTSIGFPRCASCATRRAVR